MIDPQDRTRLFEAVLESLTPVTPPAAAWPMIPSWFEGPVREPRRLLEALEAEFPVAGLLECGVVTHDPRGKFELNPELTARRMPFLALRSDAGSPCDILTPHGVLGRTELPLFRPMGDPTDLVLAFDLETVHVLRSWGLCATLATGLECLTPENVVRLSDMLGRTTAAHSAEPLESAAAAAAENGAEEPATAESPSALDDSSLTLHLVAWTPSTFGAGVPYSISQVSDFFNKLHRLRDLTFENIAVWAPSDDSREQIEFLVKQRDADHLRRAIAKTLEEDSFELTTWNVTNPPGPANYLEAREHLIRAHRISSPEEFQAAWQIFEQFLERDIIRPLLVEAQNTPDPVEKNLRFILAELSCKLHRDTATLEISNLRRRGASGLPKIPTDPLVTFREMTVLLDQITRLSRELKECRRPAPPAPRFGVPRPAMARSGNSASPPTTSGRSLARAA